MTTQASDVVVVRGEEELIARIGHLFESAADIACAANDLYTWTAARRRPAAGERAYTGKRVRKLYRPAALAPRILELLATGCKDEAAARRLGLSLRTYRRRVAELMDGLDTTSRFQAGARARELGLV